MRLIQCMLAGLAVSALVLTVQATDRWTNWRGPAGTGVVAGSYPVELGDDAVAWEYVIPGKGASTPVVVDGRVFLTTSTEDTNWVIAVGADGKELWRREFGAARAGKNGKASGSNSSPVTDGEHLFVYFKSGDFGSLSFDGEVQWHVNLQEMFGEDNLWWDLGTSPVLTRDSIVVACMQSGGSYLAAFDPQTGKLTWKQDRNLDAPNEANQSYTTPVVTTQDGREVIVVLGADHLTGHDAATGDMLWQVGGLNPEQNGFFRSISSPVVAGDLIVAPYARGTTLTAVRLGGRGDVTDSHVAWSSDEISSDVPTPAARDGQLFVLGDGGNKKHTIARIDARTGNVLEEFKLPKAAATYSSSPILAGDHLYVVREDGTVLVVSVGDTMDLVSEWELEEQAVATPVFADGKLYLRTAERLICVGG